MARATNPVIYRVLLFYVISVFFLAAVVPWDTTFAEEVIQSPFTIAFQRMGIPGADIMNFVVLTAVLCVLNSSLYTTSRMLFALTRHNDAPGFFTNTTTAACRSGRSWQGPASLTSPS